jgi:eukaryotic-like serine/threonine-protein kinase
MKRTHWAEVKRLFGEALDLPPDRHAALLADAPPTVRDDVLDLIRHRARVTGPLATGRAARGHAPHVPGSESVGPDGRAHPRTTSAESPLPPGPPSLAEGAVLAERYELGRRLGQGAFGAVHRAKDRLTGDDVAVKLLVLSGEGDQRAMRREVAVLRRARLPGLVELLDDGVEHSHAFLVMRLVDGGEFPGALPEQASGTVRWSDLAPRVIALCDALGRLHWLGVLHRDLKPANVLVDAQGAVTIVDFGIARDVDGGVDGTSGYIAGTPAYLAPERLSGGADTVASDLYALGVILYELLGGRSPRDAESLADLFRSRCDPAPSLRTLVPDLPDHVVDAVDALVQCDPALRPKSARLVAALLRGEGEDGARIKLPFVGSDAAVRAVVDAVKTKKPLDLCGPLGCGRTRTLQEADRRLTDEGYRVLWCRPGTKPFESLVPVVGEMPDEPDLTLDDLRRWLRRCLHFWLDVHVCVVADDWAALDPHSREVLASVRGSGPLIRVFDGAAGAATAVGAVPAHALEPAARTEEELRDLFHGPDRIFHLREDGARELFRRTAGSPGECVREFETWVDNGIARWEDGRCRIDRVGIDRLQSRIAPGPPRRARTAPPLDLTAIEVLSVLEIAGTGISAGCVAEAIERPFWEVEGALADLHRLGFVRTDEHGAIECVFSIDASAEVDRARRQRMHRVIASNLPSGSDARAYHCALGDDPAGFVAETLIRAKRSRETGRPESAIHALVEALAAARRNRSDPFDFIEDGEFAVILLDAALACGTLDALDTARSEFERHRSASAVLRDGGSLCAAARFASAGSWQRALEATERPCLDRRLECQRHVVRNLAARISGDRELLRSVLSNALSWARSSDHADRMWLAQSWLGWFRYVEGRYEQAARLHTLSARRRREPRGRVASLLSAASASLEAGDFATAEGSATKALAIAETHRFLLPTARALWVVRSSLYRRAAPLQPDADLVDAALNSSLPRAERARLVLNEAAVALRTGSHRRAASWARAAADDFRRHGRLAEAALSDALAHAAGSRSAASVQSAGDVRGPTGVRSQMCALLMLPPATSVTNQPDRDRSRSESATVRREVLSDAEVGLLRGLSED